MSNLLDMAIKKRKPAKATVKKRTVNSANEDMSRQLKSGAPLSDQDSKRRFGRFEGKGEATRGGTRGK